MYADILPILRDLRARYGDEAILDGGRLRGMLADVLAGEKEGERRLLLRVLGEGLPQRMLAGETAEGTLRGWASQLAARLFIQEEALLAAMLCWRMLLCPDAGGAPKKARPATPPPAPAADMSAKARLAERERWMNMVRRNGFSLRNVPEALRDRKMCLAAVRQDGWALQHVPAHLRDREICLEAVRLNGWALEHVPWHLRDREICLEAVKQDGGALGYVPDHLRSDIRRLLGWREKPHAASSVASSGGSGGTPAKAGAVSGGHSRTQGRPAAPSSAPRGGSAQKGRPAAPSPAPQGGSDPWRGIGSAIFLFLLLLLPFCTMKPSAPRTGALKPSAPQAVATHPAGHIAQYLAAAKQGDANAQYYLGYCYHSGRGVPQDDAKAVFWYGKAAEQGHAGAQDDLGKCYEYGGCGVPRDPAQAVKWYRKAAEQGHAGAQYSLGVCYEFGIGIPKDPAEAVRWYRKAVKLGIADARESLARLEKSNSKKRNRR